jgi:hypothetical protein
METAWFERVTALYVLPRSAPHAASPILPADVFHLQRSRPENDARRWHTMGILFGTVLTQS